MEDFLKQWGPAIITAVAVFIVIAIVVAFKGQLTDALQGIFADFSTKATNAMNTTIETTTAAGTP